MTSLGVTVESRKRPDSPAHADTGSSTDQVRRRAVELAEEFAQSWRRGERQQAEEWLSRINDSAACPEAAWFLILEEIRLRRETGPPPTLLEFASRFPQHAELLRTMFQETAVAPEAEPRFPKCGESLAGCRLVSELGRGAEGRIYLATQEELGDRPVVLKVTACRGSEHLALARLFHSHIMPLYFVHDCRERDLRVLAMPYLGGASLEDVLATLAPVPVARRTGADVLNALDSLQERNSRPTLLAGPARALWARASYVEAVCWLGAGLAEALDYAHERGLVHLDIKPSNVLLASDGQPLLLDFHLARAPVLAGSPMLEAFGGTFDFMAPEQSRVYHAVREGKAIPETVDARADIYSLGLVLYEALGGERYVTENRRQSLRSHNSHVSRGLSDVIGKCLDHDPRRRYQGAAALAADLRRHLAHQPLRGVANRSLVERWRKWRTRRPHALTKALLAGAALAMLLALVVVIFGRGTGQLAEVRAALTEGKERLRQGRPEEADWILARGLERADGLPGNGELIRALEAERHRARTALFLRELHGVADRLRFLGDPETMSVEAAARLADQCERLWELRGTVLSAEDLPGVNAEQTREDWLDLALLGTRWRMRGAAAADKEAAHRKALQVLREVQELAGASHVIARELAHHEAALNEERDAKASMPVASPQSPWEQYALGRSLLEEGDLPAAAAALTEAVRARPGAFWPNFYAGVCAHRQGRDDDALAAFTACIALAPEAAASYCNRGLALAARDRDTEARRDFDRSLELDPNLAAARLGRAALALKQSRTDDAAIDLNQALAAGAEPAVVHYNLALCYYARRDYSAARASLQTCLQYRPDHAKARELLSRLPRQ